MWKNMPVHRSSTLIPSDLLKNFFAPNFVDDFFDHNVTTSNMYLRTDIRETDQEFVIEAEMPGFNRDDITVEWEEGHLLIAAKKEYSTDENQDNYVRRERRLGEVSRRFVVDNIKPEEIKGEYKDGILTIVLPKAGPAKNDKLKIDIH